MQDGALHHVHKRKRIHLKKEKYPSPNKWVRLMDKLIYLVAIAGPLITLPQVFKIWIEQNPSGVSVISWSGYFLGAFFWVTYGFIHKEKPIILANLLWIILTSLIVVGVFIYS